jgi:Fe-S-cluster formation regulator IscX/YfhJ
LKDALVRSIAEFTDADFIASKLSDENTKNRWQDRMEIMEDLQEYAMTSVVSIKEEKFPTLDATTEKLIPEYRETQFSQFSENTGYAQLIADIKAYMEGQAGFLKEFFDMTQKAVDEIVLKVPKQQSQDEDALSDAQQQAIIGGVLGGIVSACENPMEFNFVKLLTDAAMSGMRLKEDNDGDDEETQEKILSALFSCLLDEDSEEPTASAGPARQ